MEQVNNYTVADVINAVISNISPKLKQSEYPGGHFGDFVESISEDIWDEQVSQRNNYEHHFGRKGARNEHKLLPFIDYPRKYQILYGLSVTCSYGSKRLNQRTRVLKHLNQIFNQYLVDVHFLRQVHGNYQLTDLGYQCCRNPRIALDRFFRSHHVYDYVPFIPIPDLLLPIFKAVQFSATHRELHNAIGITLLHSLNNLDLFKQANKLEHSTGSKEVSAYMNPMAYYVLFMSLINMFLCNYFINDSDLIIGKPLSRLVLIMCMYDRYTGKYFREKSTK